MNIEPAIFVGADIPCLEDTLPELPSALIRLAVKDLEACQHDKRYHINMRTWHCAEELGLEVCTVCLAGSVLAQECHVSAAHSLSWANTGAGLRLVLFDAQCVPQQQLVVRLERKLQLLNTLRGNDVRAIKVRLHDLGWLTVAQYTAWQPPQTVLYYAYTPFDDWKQSMLDLATELEHRGL